MVALKSWIELAKRMFNYKIGSEMSQCDQKFVIYCRTFLNGSQAHLVNAVTLKLWFRLPSPCPSHPRPVTSILSSHHCQLCHQVCTWHFIAASSTKSTFKSPIQDFTFSKTLFFKTLIILIQTFWYSDIWYRAGTGHLNIGPVFRCQISKSWP